MPKALTATAKAEPKIDGLGGGASVGLVPKAAIDPRQKQSFNSLAYGAARPRRHLQMMHVNNAAEKPMRFLCAVPRP